MCADFISLVIVVAFLPPRVGWGIGGRENFSKTNLCPAFRQRSESRVLATSSGQNHPCIKVVDLRVTYSHDLHKESPLSMHCFLFFLLSQVRATLPEDTLNCESGCFLNLCTDNAQLRALSSSIG